MVDFSTCDLCLDDLSLCSTVMLPGPVDNCISFFCIERDFYPCQTYILVVPFLGGEKSSFDLLEPHLLMLFFPSLQLLTPYSYRCSWSCAGGEGTITLKPSFLPTTWAMQLLMQRRDKSKLKGWPLPVMAMRDWSQIKMVFKSKN